MTERVEGIRQMPKQMYLTRYTSCHKDNESWYTDPEVASCLEMNDNQPCYVGRYELVETLVVKTGDVVMTPLGARRKK